MRIDIAETRPPFVPRTASRVYSSTAKQVNFSNSLSVLGFIRHTRCFLRSFAWRQFLSSEDCFVPISREFMYPRTEKEEFVKRWMGWREDNWEAIWEASRDCFRDWDWALRRLAMFSAE